MPKIRTGSARGDGAGALLPALRERIARHTLPPGAKLLENDLAREFGVSRAKVRDAFGVLEQRGLIQRIPNRGAVVARLDLSQVFEIYAVREMLEGLCARLAVERTKPSSWQDLVQVFGRPMETIVKRGEFEKYIANLDELRSRTLEAAGNRRAGRHARQHQRQNARNPAPHHYPAGPRGRRPGTASRGAGRNAQGRRRRSRRIAPRQHPQLARISRALSNLRSLGTRMPAPTASSAQGPLAGYRVLEIGLDRRGPLLRPPVRRLRRRSHQGRSLPTATPCARWACAIATNRCRPRAYSATNR